MTFNQLRLPYTVLGLVLFVMVSVMQTRPAQASKYQLGLQTGLSLNSASANLSLEGGMKIDDAFSVLGKFDWNPWFNSQDFNNSFKAGVLNVGIGAEYRFFNDRCRTAVYAGPSILLFNTALDEQGSTGFFFEVQPISIRWPLTDDFAIRLDPASVHLVVPVLTGIPLISFQYRHSVAVEWNL